METSNKSTTAVLNTPDGAIRPHLRASQVWRFLNQGKVDVSRLPLTQFKDAGEKIQMQMNIDLHMETQRLVHRHYDLKNGRDEQRELAGIALQTRVQYGMDNPYLPGDQDDDKEFRRETHQPEGEEDDYQEAGREFMLDEAAKDFEDYDNEAESEVC